MSTDRPNASSSVAIREQLELLEREAATAHLCGLARNALYMADLSAELQAARSAYVVAAVAEIASLRASLDAPLAG